MYVIPSQNVSSAHLSWVRKLPCGFAGDGTIWFFCRGRWFGTARPCPLMAGYCFALQPRERWASSLCLYRMIWEKEIKNKDKTGESEEVAANHTHLDSASCVQHFREIRLQLSRLGMYVSQSGKGKALAATQPELSQTSGTKILQYSESCSCLFQHN